jgi:protein TonB
VLVKGADANYPPAALRSRQSGWVIVSFTILPNGRTDNVTVVSSQPRRVFDRAAMEAVNRYRFTPAMKDGVAVSSVRSQKIEFNL